MVVYKSASFVIWHFDKGYPGVILRHKVQIFIDISVYILFKNDKNKKNAFQGRLMFGCDYHW